MRHDDSGAVAIIVALFALVLFGFAALVVDVGNASDVRAQASAAADAGALAGEAELANWATAHPTAQPDEIEEGAIETAVQTAVAHSYPLRSDAWVDCTDTVPGDFTAVGSTQCVQYQITRDTNGVVVGTQVRVRIPVRRVPSTFGGIFGNSAISVSPFAAAGAGQESLPDCEPCNPPIGEDGQPVAAATYSLPDGIDTPATAGTYDPSTDCPLTPGIFSDDLDTNADCLSMAPGVYVFDNASLTIGGALDAAGVTLIFKDGGTLAVNPEGQLRIMAPTAGSDPAIVFEAEPVASPVSFSLGPRFFVKGDVYALAGTVWQTAADDCPAAGGCEVDGVLAVSATDFADPDVVPTVRTVPMPPLPPPSAEHRSE